ncbi:MAG: SDR family oxidoreductase [Pyrinomonadaceae bacterium]
MKAFVTGATGLLGNNLVRALVERGFEVKALVRSEKKAEKLFGRIPVEFVVGDMEEVAGFAAGMKDCDVLFHTAAYFREYYESGADHWAKLENINIKGSVRILEEAEKQGVKKAIYVSSSGTIGLKPDGSPGDEDTPPSPFAGENLYFKSKVLADRAVADFAGKSSMPVVQILPGWMFGLGDAAPTSSGQIVLDFLNGKLPGTFDGGTSTVDAADVAEAMIEAVEKGRAGEKYIVGGEFYTIEEIVGNLAEVSGLPPLKLKIPGPFILAFAGLAELFSRLTGRPALISKPGIKTMRARLAVDSGKAKRELGAKFRPLAETLKAEINWYRENGYAS